MAPLQSTSRRYQGKSFSSRPRRPFVPTIKKTSREREEEKGIITKRGTIAEILPAKIYRVTMEDGTKVLAHISGRMRHNLIRVFPGNDVKIEFSKHDMTKGRIVYRF
ncbi:MAG: translation initiation factor IF-1 [Candidatus Colwellbacteria bacterium]|nr:translation initiation factor IF-1 [Candidatus Colwellbacteria bacterium]